MTEYACVDCGFRRRVESSTDYGVAWCVDCDDWQSFRKLRLTVGEDGGKP